MKLTWAEREATYRDIAAWCERNENITHVSEGMVNVPIPDYETPGEHGVHVIVDLSTTAPSCYTFAVSQAVFEADRKQGANSVRDAINKS